LGGDHRRGSEPSGGINILGRKGSRGAAAIKQKKKEKGEGPPERRFGSKKSKPLPCSFRPHHRREGKGNHPQVFDTRRKRGRRDKKKEKKKRERYSTAVENRGTKDLRILDKKEGKEKTDLKAWNSVLGDVPKKQKRRGETGDRRWLSMVRKNSVGKSSRDKKEQLHVAIKSRERKEMLQR